MREGIYRDERDGTYIARLWDNWEGGYAHACRLVETALLPDRTFDPEPWGEQHLQATPGVHRMTVPNLTEGVVLSRDLRRFYAQDSEKGTQRDSFHLAPQFFYAKHTLWDPWDDEEEREQWPGRGLTFELPKGFFL